MGSHTVILNTRRGFFFFRRNCPHSTDCSCHCWSRQIRPHILCIWDGIVSLWPPLRPPTATLAGGCKKTIRIQIIPGPERSWRGWNEDVEGDEVRERRIRCCSLSVQRPPACTPELCTHTYIYLYIYIYLNIRCTLADSLQQRSNPNPRQPINKHLTGTEIQYREQHQPAGSSAPFKLQFDSWGGKQRGEIGWRCLDWSWHGAPIHWLQKPLFYRVIFVEYWVPKVFKRVFLIPVLLF